MKYIITMLVFITLTIYAQAQYTITDSLAKAGSEGKMLKSGQEFTPDKTGANNDKATLTIAGVKKENDDYKKYSLKYKNLTTGNDTEIDGKLEDNNLTFDLASSIEEAKGIYRLFFDGKEKGVIQFTVQQAKVGNGGNGNPTSLATDPSGDKDLLKDATKAALNYIRSRNYREDKRTTLKRGNTILLLVDAQGNYLVKGPPTSAFRQNTYQVVLFKRKEDPMIYQLIPPVSFLSDQFNIYGDTVKISKQSAAGETGIEFIEFAEIGPYEEAFNIQVKKTNPLDVTKTSNIIDTRVSVAKLYHVSIQGALLSTSLRDPQNIMKSVMENGDTTLTADDPKGRGLFAVMAVWYPWGRSFVFPPRGGLFSKERFGVVVGVRADKDQFKNFLGGLQFDFARGGSISLGVHYGRHTVVTGKKRFDFGKDVFTGNITEKVRQDWDLGAYIGVNIDIRVLNFLFGGALTQTVD